MKDIVLIGGGGHALSILEIVNALSLPVMGYVDMKENSDIPIPYLGNDSCFLSNNSPLDIQIVLGVVYTQTVDMQLRSKLLTKYKGYTGKTIVAKSAILSDHTCLGNGTVVFEKALINRSDIGEHCVINSGAIIEHDCKIEDNVFIGPGAIVGGGVTIRRNTFIGAGVIIRDGVTITSDVTIGMGSLVLKDIKCSGMYYGNPLSLKSYLK